MVKLCLLVVATLMLGPQDVKGQMKGGHPVKPGEFPFHAFLMDGGVYNFCSGALISSRHILSAGHCVEDAQKLGGSLTVLVGTNRIGEGGWSYSIASYAFKREYSKNIPPNWNSDIGMVKLVTDVECSDLVRIVNLPSDTEIQTGLKIFFTAAGGTTIYERMEYLRCMKVTVVSNEICQTSFSESFSKYEIDEEGYICTMPPSGRGVMLGDDGGPLVKDNIILGISAGCIDPSRRDTPEIFIKVVHYLPWISETRSTM